LPAKTKLRSLLKKTGPLAAPSANPEGLPPAKTIKEAKKYFRDRVDFYLDAGRLDSRPSAILSLKNGKIKVRRAGNRFSDIASIYKPESILRAATPES
jgi:L-threonylcarbamoyladenylate synthase